MIEVENLNKRYGSLPAVSDVSFRCVPGTVTGFVGPNGAGKSTTLRMICGLAEPSSGRATVLGAAYRAIPNPGRHVGVLLDASAQHRGRTGEETLNLAAMTLGVERARVAAVLDEVGLGGRAARTRVRAYSLGMRQRLGIAHALLGEPEVLILDEPANGLDPEGIVWMRRLLRDFADRAGTVLLSSHLLREVEKVADELVVIGGRARRPEGRGGRAAGRRRRSRGAVPVAAHRGSVAMSAAALPAFAPEPPMPRLVAIELRKTVDTRAGFWVLASSALLTLVVVAVTLASGDERDQVFGVFFARTVGTAGLLIPMLGILAVTSEWSQRTALTTFALVPRRERVIAAKLLAGLSLAVASVVVCLVASLAATALVPVAGHGAGTWDVAASAVGASALFLAIWMAAGAALGLLVMNSATAIVLSFLVPVAVAALATGVPGAEHALRWIDLGTASGELVATHLAVSAHDWARLAAGVAVWVLLPLAIGLVRLRRREVTFS